MHVRDDYPSAGMLLCATHPRECGHSKLEDMYARLAQTVRRQVTNTLTAMRGGSNAEVTGAGGRGRYSTDDNIGAT